MAKAVYFGDKYRMIKKISREGNMATVYRCKDDFDNEYAIKLFDKHIGNDDMEDYQQRSFSREVETLKRAQHENIVKIFEHDLDDKSHLDVSELEKYFLWVAQYNAKCTATHRVDIWQYTSSGTIMGINGKVDISECYVDFSEESQNADVEKKKNLYWVTIADVWTEEEAREAAKNLKNAYPNLAMGIRLSDEEINKIKFCMEKTGMTKTGVVRAGIDLVYEQIMRG